MSSLHALFTSMSVVPRLNLIEDADAVSTAPSNFAVTIVAEVAFASVILVAAVVGFVGSSSFGATTVTLEVKVYLLVFPVFLALKLTLIAAGLFSSVATKPRTVTTVPALLFFFPVKFFDFDG